MTDPAARPPLTPLEQQQLEALLADLARQHVRLPVQAGLAPAPPAPPTAPPGSPVDVPQPPIPQGPPPVEGLAPAPAQPPGPGPSAPAGLPGLPGPSFAAPLPMPPPGGAPPPMPVPGDMAPVPAVPPDVQAEQARIAQEAELARQTSAESEHLGQGARPRRGSTMEHPLDRAASQLAGELQENAKRLAGELFPNGPAGTVQPTKAALGGYVRRHWDDPTFRQVLLDRMAPKAPDGNRVPWGVRSFMDLYRTEVEPYRLPDTVGQPQAPPPQGQPPPLSQPASPPAPTLSPGPEAGLPPPTGPNALGV